MCVLEGGGGSAVNEAEFIGLVLKHIILSEEKKTLFKIFPLVIVKVIYK